MKGKYVITINGPILLPLWMPHSDFRYLNPGSAGFFSEENGEINTYGMSQSLGIGSRENDSSIIKNAFKS